MCSDLAQQLYAEGLEAEADANQVDTFNKRIRNAQIEQWNFILVVGAKEVILFIEHTPNKGAYKQPLFSIFVV